MHNINLEVILALPVGFNKTMREILEHENLIRWYPEAATAWRLARIETLKDHGEATLLRAGYVKISGLV